MSNFSIFNVHGLKPNTIPSKVPYIADRLIESNQLFMGITETWLKDHKDAELYINGYTLFRADRKRRRKGCRGRLSGGVAAYVRDDIARAMETRISFSNGVIELLGLYSPIENIFIAVVYRQPDDIQGQHRSTSAEFKEAMGKLGDALQKLSTPTPNIIICGDFNLPHTTWPMGVPTTSASKNDKEMMDLLNKFLNDHFLTQHIVKPTHIRGNTLDLVFTNNSYLLHSYECIKPLQSVSDHYVIECCTQFNSIHNQLDEVKPDLASPFDKLNFHSDEIKWDEVTKEFQAINWSDELIDLHPDEMLSKFMQILLAVCSRLVPIKKSTSISTTTKIPRERRNLMRKRRALEIKLGKTSSVTRIRNIEGKLTNIEILLQKSYQATHQQGEMRAVQSIKSNPKYFFAYAKKFSKIKTKIGPLLDENNQYTASSQDMANIFKKQYDSVFSDPMSSSIYSEGAKIAEENLIDLQFTPVDFQEAIDELSNNSSSGPDGVPAIFLKKCKMELSGPLSMLWRKILDLGITPDILKLAHIIPIHKGDHRGLAQNYRPIALTSHIIKLFEKVLRKKIVQYLEENNLLNDSQHGFRQGRSCLSQLLAQYDKIVSLMEKGLNVDTVYLDFSKAFDKVDHLIVIEKLSLLGIGGKILKWIKSFLLNRRQCVITNGFSSEPSHVRSGVPQGSVIGPLLFLILIGDIDAELYNSFLSSFADDTRASKGVASPRDISLLQTDLDVIYQWAQNNNMTFNSKKLELLRYGNNSALKAETSYLSPDGTQIPEKAHVKDLGVIMSNSGNFSEHINTVCQKAREMCSWILRTFKSRSPVVMKTLWKSLVLPILDYCSQLWCPIRAGQIKQLEEIQQSFTRKIRLDEQLDYWERLNFLKINSLQRRRERYRIIYVWKILEQQVPNISCEGNSGIQKLHLEHARNGRTCKIPFQINSAPAKIKHLREGSFKHHGSQLFNALPKDLRNITNCSLSIFKTRLDNFLQKIDDMPLVRGYTAGRRTVSNSLIHTIPQFIVDSESGPNPLRMRSDPSERWC